MQSISEGEIKEICEKIHSEGSSVLENRLDYPKFTVEELLRFSLPVIGRWQNYTHKFEGIHSNFPIFMNRFVSDMVFSEFENVKMIHLLCSSSERPVWSAQHPFPKQLECGIFRGLSALPCMLVPYSVRAIELERIDSTLPVSVKISCTIYTPKNKHNYMTRIPTVTPIPHLDNNFGNHIVLCTNEGIGSTMNETESFPSQSRFKTHFFFPQIRKDTGNMSFLVWLPEKEIESVLEHEDLREICKISKDTYNSIATRDHRVWKRVICSEGNFGKVKEMILSHHPNAWVNHEYNMTTLDDDATREEINKYVRKECEKYNDICWRYSWRSIPAIIHINSEEEFYRYIDS